MLIMNGVLPRSRGTPWVTSAAPTSASIAANSHRGSQRLFPGRSLTGGFAADGRVPATAGVVVAVYCPTSAQTQRQFSLPPPGLHRLQCRPRSAGLPVANHAVIHSSFCEFTLCHVYAHVFGMFRLRFVMSLPFFPMFSQRFRYVFGTFAPPALKRRAGQGIGIS